MELLRRISSVPIIHSAKKLLMLFSKLEGVVGRSTWVGKRVNNG